MVCAIYLPEPNLIAVFRIGVIENISLFLKTKILVSSLIYILA